MPRARRPGSMPRLRAVAEIADCHKTQERVSFTVRKTNGSTPCTLLNECESRSGMRERRLGGPPTPDTRREPSRDGRRASASVDESPHAPRTGCGFDVSRSCAAQLQLQRAGHRISHALTIRASSLIRHRSSHTSGYVFLSRKVVMNVHFHCMVTVSPGMADLSGHTACPGRI